MTSRTPDPADGAERPMRAVVVEDDRDIRDLVTLVLRSTGLQVTEAGDAATGLALVRELRPDLVTLDLGLPDLDGMEVCRRLRGFSDAYVLMLTARAAEIDLLLGLESGADDYLVKPFSPRELGARVNALLRRPRVVPDLDEPLPDPGPAELVHHDLLLDEGRRTVRRGPCELELTKTEYDLLLALAKNSDRVMSKNDLLASVWGITWAGGDGHLVETHMGNLRRKLGPGPQGGYVRTVRGVGYRLS